MSLENHTLLHEDDDQYVLHDGQNSFVVAKKGLGKALQAKISQHFATGGEVDDDLANTNPTESFQDAPVVATRPDGGMVNPFGGRLPTESAGPPGVVADPSFDPSKMVNPPVALQPTYVDAPAPSPEEQAAQARAATTVPPKPDQKPAKPPGYGNGYGKQLSDAEKKEESAADAQAKVAGDQAKAEAELMKRGQVDAQAVRDKYDQQIQNNTARVNNLFEETQNGKIDANRLWNNTSTGGKITASIGMILGGIGAGMTGGPNYAFQTIQSAIERDVDAQKANLNQKNNALRMYMEQGHTLQEARQHAIADAEAKVAGSIAVASKGFVDPAAKAAAEAAKAKFMTDSIGRVQESAQRGQALELGKLQLDQARAVMGQNQQTQQVSTLLGSVKGGVPVDPQTAARMFEHPQIGKVLVRLPNGNLGMAVDEKAKENLNSVMAKTSEVSSTLKQMEAMRAKNPHGFSTTLNPTDAAVAEHLHDQLTMQLKELGSLQAGNDPNARGEILKMYDRMAPSLDSYHLSSEVNKKKIGGLEEQIKNHNNAAFRVGLRAGG